ncbi:competence protein ComE [Myxacorys almedinensis A]|uniref:phospholipase D n=2 Tax=Myxacorys TaxID=2056239 RepID=A0A8J8CKJ0_9CYAN|nr:phospholipase D-like domain-containing protein [Myxacorys almedinensis]NDJ16700.1 competence protein ComE [Myxacorys almedinensis A]
MALGLAACQPVQPQTVLPTPLSPDAVRPSPLPQDPLIQVYSNHNPASQYREPYRQQTRSGDDLEQLLVDAINTAKLSIDIAVQEFRLPNVARALRDRAASGVQVRVILENTYSRPFSTFTADEVSTLPARNRSRYTEARQLIDRNGDGQLSLEEINDNDALVVLDNAKIPRIDDTEDGSRGSKLMHHKFMVIDGLTVISTSANWTTSDVHGDFSHAASRGNANNLLKIKSSDLANLFLQEFSYLWGDGVGGQKDSLFGVKKPYRAPQLVKVGATPIVVQFSPSSSTRPWAQTTNGLISQTLVKAKQSIKLALFVFSDQPLVNALEPLSDRGVQIQALIEPTFMYRSYSEGLDMLGITLSDQCKAEPNNRPWKTPITTVGVPRLPPGDLLHHKFGIVDHHTVITGSHNWSDVANRGNDETLLVIANPTVTAHFRREFERLYKTATLGIPPAIQRKVDAQQQACPQLVVPQTFEKIKASDPIGQKVNLNTAPQAELEALPGVGSGMAKRIIAARQQQPFATLDDVERIPGVGAKLLARWRDRITW